MPGPRSQCIEIPAGEYEFSMFYRTMLNQPSSPDSPLSYVQRFRVYLTTDPDDMSQATLLYDNDSVIVKDKYYAKLLVPVTVAADGNYYIVINCYSPKGNGCLYLDDIELKPTSEAQTTLPYSSDFLTHEDEWYHYSPASNIEQWSAQTEGDETFMESMYIWYDYDVESNALPGSAGGSLGGLVGRRFGEGDDGLHDHDRRPLEQPRAEPEDLHGRQRYPRLLYHAGG